jgi:tagatose-6-phosphate ketose/aldose isomerase
MGALSELLALPQGEKAAKGLVFTPHEIFQQPATWEKSYQDVLRFSPQVKEFLEYAGVGSKAGPKPTVFLLGAGTSDYIGRSLSQLLRKEWQCQVEAIPSTDMLTEMDDLIIPGQPYLWISFSRSGESSEAVAVVEKALSHYPEIRHLIITCNKNGRLVEQFGKHPGVLCIVLDDAVNDRGLAMTSSFSNMVVAGQCLAHYKDLTRYEPVLNNILSLGEKFIGPAAETAAQLATEGYAKICFIGTGPLKAVALESALKVLELTAGKIYTMSESYLGIRHGPLSAIDDDTLIVGFLSEDPRRKSYELDLVEEIRAKNLGRKRLVVCLDDDDRVNDLADYVISCGTSERVPDEYRPPVDVMFGQLLGLFSSLQHGLKPDNPSPNGAINRVVSKIKTYYS